MWINLWLSAQSMANQTGRRPFLLSDGTIEESSDWHLSPYRVSGDVILVAQIMLRQVLKELLDLVMRSSHQTSREHNNSLDIANSKYCLHRIQKEMKQWNQTWSKAEPTSPRSGKLRRKC